MKKHIAFVGKKMKNIIYFFYSSENKRLVLKI